VHAKDVVTYVRHVGARSVARLRAVLLWAFVANVAADVSLGSSAPYVSAIPSVLVVVAVFGALTNRLRARRLRARAKQWPKPVRPAQLCADLDASGLAARGPAVVAVTLEHADIETSPRWSVNSVVELGSITKSMTGLVLASLVLDGALRLEDRVGEFIEVDEKLADVTLVQLASHTSGLPRLGPRPLLQIYRRFATGNRQPYRGWESDGVLRVARQARPRFVYSNLGFALLAYVLAAATGEQYADLLRERVFAPAGMTDSTLITNDNMREPGHSAFGMRTAAWVGTSGAGGVQSSVADIGRLLSALTNPRSELAAPFALARAPVVETPVKYGLGWVTSDRPDGSEIWWHNGGTAGFSTFFGVRGETGAFVAVDRGGVSVDAAGLALLGG
jgi:CubicO group peptidase (beta-lactamase class C family)